MRGRGRQAVLTVRGDNLTAPSSVTGFARATFPLEGGRLFGSVPFAAFYARACPKSILQSGTYCCIISAEGYPSSLCNAKAKVLKREKGYKL
jgi:hypothetical protein